MESFCFILLALQVIPGASGSRPANEDRKAQRERDAALKKENKIISALAGKALPALQPLSKRLEGLSNVLLPKEDQLPAMTARLLHESRERLAKMVHNFQQVMVKVSKNQAVCFEDVSFTVTRDGQDDFVVNITCEKELQSEIKSLQEGCKALQTAKKSFGK